MDISLLLVDYREAPPEGTRDNGGGIQWERNLCFFFSSPKEHRFPKNTEQWKTLSSNRHPWMKELCPLHKLSTFESRLLSSLTDQKAIDLSLSALVCPHNPLVRVFLVIKRALLPCPWGPFTKSRIERLCRSHNGTEKTGPLVNTMACHW